ncbi:Uncharacterised protein [Mycolicibacterium flavescens]|nr:Uncharacterised protein [Mycolicibacterium flavescens]
MSFSDTSPAILAAGREVLQRESIPLERRD